MSPELAYVALVFALFVFPRFLQRFRLPAAITSILLGALAGIGLGLWVGDTTIQMLATLGIVALFLFAGLEVDLGELRRNGPVLAQHLAIAAGALGLAAWGLTAGFDLPPRVAILIALALLTPSAGFILDSLGGLDFSPKERFWIKSKVVANELLALGTLFLVLQSASALQLLLSVLAIAAIIVLLPLALRTFAVHVAPYAPRSEFTFLLMLALVCAFATYKLGVYYLVGAFVVGMAAQRFRRQLPALASEEMVRAVELFASFFVPFYFFRVGVHLQRGDFSLASLLLGGAFLLLIPLRLGVVAIHRRLALREGLGTGHRVAAAMLPTLVFTLVIAEILRDQFAVDPAIYGGLVIYTLLNTLLPSLLIEKAPTAFEAVHAPVPTAPPPLETVVPTTPFTPPPPIDRPTTGRNGGG